LCFKTPACRLLKMLSERIPRPAQKAGLRGESIPHMPNTADLICICRKISGLIEPVLDEMDFELVDVEYLSEHGRWVLRIYVDKEGGITVNDCARVSREIGDLIDVKDIFEHDYVLEVSSPGLNRTLKKEKDFLQAMGKKIKIKMGMPVDGRKIFTGYLRGFGDGTLLLDVDKRMFALSLRDVKKANMVYEFGD
jgi:ribosome maturation factor RimP